MSQKSGKKLRKRLDDATETPSKLAAIEVDEVQEENVENGVENQKIINNGKSEETEVNGTSENGLKIDDEFKEQSTQEEVANNVKEEDEVQIIIQEDVVQEEKLTEPVENEENKRNGEENQETKEENKSKISNENEMEALLLESEEGDPELEFEESSDFDSQKSSPVLRCRTRRSHTRNIPVPKTPKALDTNNDDKSSECLDKPSIFMIPTLEITDTESEGSVFKLVADAYDPNQKLLGKSVVNEDFESFENISTKAVIGSDTTINADLTAYPDGEFSPFLSESKDRSVAETLKFMSGRRSIRSTKDYGLLPNIKREHRALPFLSKNPFDKTGGTKRRSDNDSTDYSKRFKSESPHVFSYIYNLKDRITKTEIPSSTPKLTGYKTKKVFDNTSVSKISLDESEEVDEKKWCTLM